MPIRVKHRDKLGARVQPSKDQELSAQLATGSIACYAGRNAKIRVLRGSVYSLLRKSKHWRDHACNLDVLWYHDLNVLF